LSPVLLRPAVSCTLTDTLQGYPTGLLPSTSHNAGRFRILAPRRGHPPTVPALP